jgi:hypothetical protein
MWTIWLITLVENDQVAFKCIVGCDGYNIQKTTQAIQNMQSITAKELYDICLETWFWEIDCLVIQSKNESYHKTEDNLSDLYKSEEKFNNPEFNPRWEIGMSDFFEIIDITK